MASSTRRKASTGDDARNAYLLAYNVGSALAWAFVLERVVRRSMSAGTFHLLRLDLTATTRRQFTLLPKVFRSEWNDVLQVLYTTTHHVILFCLQPNTQRESIDDVFTYWSLVRSSLSATLMQVASRIWMVWFVTYVFPEVTSNPFYASMVFAWSTTEVIRYSHYACGIVDLKLHFLEWLRYSTFYVLYPLGATSEAALMYSSAQFARSKFGQVGLIVMGGLTLIWPPALFVMMKHMQVQRRKYLGGGGKRSTLKSKKRL